MLHGAVWKSFHERDLACHCEAGDSKDKRTEREIARSARSASRSHFGQEHRTSVEKKVENGLGLASPLVPLGLFIYFLDDLSVNYW